MARVPDKYDTQQELHLGKVSEGYKLKQGTGAFMPVIGDTLTYTEEGADPRWVNLTPIIGNLTWSAQQSGPFSQVLAVASTWYNLEPTNAQGGMVLNPVSFQMTQPSNGQLESVDNFTWSCYLSLSILWDLNGAVGNFIGFRIVKNGVPTDITVGAQSNAGTATNFSYIDGWVTIANGDILQLQASNSSGAGATLRVYTQTINVMAIRLLT